MIISFDLDGVLFVDPEKFETEPPLARPLRRLFPDRLRKGTVHLIRELKARKYKVWVYTSSYRSELYIKALFRHYHISFDRIVNGYRHDREVQRDKVMRLPNKMPGYYRISLHIDDEESVVNNGKVYGFRVLRVSAPDPSWTEKVLAEADRIRESEKNIFPH